MAHFFKTWIVHLLNRLKSSPFITHQENLDSRIVHVSNRILWNWPKQRCTSLNNDDENVLNIWKIHMELLPSALNKTRRKNFFDIVRWSFLHFVKCTAVVEEFLKTTEEDNRREPNNRCQSELNEKCLKQIDQHRRNKFRIDAYQFDEDFPMTIVHR